MQSTMAYPRVASLKTHEAFVDRLTELGLDMPSDSEILAGERSPLAKPIHVDGLDVGNRFCVLPMEGWDGTDDGKPTDLTR
jgi:hypothetical protein